MSAGALFTEDFLLRGLPASPAWRLDEIAGLEDRFRDIVAAVKKPEGLNEEATKKRLIEPMLSELGWDGAYTVQETLDAHGRKNVPDFGFFPDPESFALADGEADAEARLMHAIAIGDAKAWDVGFDARGSGAAKGETAAGQALRYLIRAEVQSNRKVRYAILTNGRVWRLYYAGAKSLLDGYFEADVVEILALRDVDRRAREFATFVLLFRRVAFLPDPALDGQTLHAFALDEGRKWEARVRESLSRVVFDEVFPGLVRGLAAADREARKPYTRAYFDTLREAALTLLYRLLFALYAEDRDLLPAHDARYKPYSLSALRDEIAERVDAGVAFSGKGAQQWRTLASLFGFIDEGEPTLGVPAYNGGLFSMSRAPLIDRVALPDSAFAPLIDRLSREEKDGRRVRINFRDLSVRELGAIYEGLLEYEPAVDAEAPQGIAIRLNPFSRKNTGSYYTPDELVALVIERTVGPLIDERIAAFEAKADELAHSRRPVEERRRELLALDPAERILELRVCDPAMGSGHFLVNLIDRLALEAFTAMGRAASRARWAEYESPLAKRIAEVRERIRVKLAEAKLPAREDQLTDQNLVKRMALKRCVYGVDKNSMAVELAKLSVWLHTFTVGAPLSFLDHHLRSGDSLFGERVRKAMDELQAMSPLLINEALGRAQGAIQGMETVEHLTDSDLEEVRASETLFHEVEQRVAPLDRFLSFWQAVKWLQPLPKSKNVEDNEEGAFSGLMAGSFGDPLEVAAGLAEPVAANGGNGRHDVAVKRVIERARALAEEERFFNWEVAFPGVWRNWQSDAPEGGFDAVIGNPPWDRMKMQEVEWFSARAPGIAKQARAADRKAAIVRLKTAGDPLAGAYEEARARAETAMERARKCGDYPLLSKGDINLYSLFVERAQGLLKPTGIAGLLTPSGIASDLTASAFFKSVAAAGRVACLFDFENRRGEGRAAFFPDVDSRFKFCVFVVGGPKRGGGETDCAFFLRDPPERAAPEQRFTMTARDFALVNPNTGTAPIFRTKRDAQLTTAIYRRLPVLVDRSSGTEAKAWPVRYSTMFHMTNDSALFWTRERLEKHGAYPVELGRWKKGKEEWVPLYEGKMVQAFDHRAASVVVNLENLHRPAQQEMASESEHQDPNLTAIPQYWVPRDATSSFGIMNWVCGFKEITSPTNERTLISAIVPAVAFGNKLPLWIPDEWSERSDFLLVADFNSFPHDYVTRQKIHGQTLNLFLVEQLPVVPPSAYSRPFGPKTAAEIVGDHVLRLTYTAYDMRPFARDLGYEGEPFRWNENERRHLRARLDALYFHLYGIESEDDIRYILSTFPIVERKDRAAHDGVYLTAELIIWYFRALAAGDPDAEAPEAALVRAAKRA
ncbi:MAG: Eco57I restriction-modification methylase domain-containing protein [Roseiarcus sp.]